MSVAIQRFGAVPAPVGFATGMAGPTLLVHGTEDQKRRHLRGMVTGSDGYCQLFSEPNAGSDLAGLQTTAVLDGDDWVVNGQKVWTSGGQVANRAMLVARTNVDVPKHAGISYFLLRMDQPGIEVRPLRENGRSRGAGARPRPLGRGRSRATSTFPPAPSSSSRTRTRPSLPPG